MANQTKSTRRTASAQKSGTGLKALILAASVAMTIGGWGILAASQAQNALAASPLQASVQPASPTIQTGSRATNSIQFQPAAPVARPLAIARTRSSR